MNSIESLGEDHHRQPDQRGRETLQGLQSYII